MRALFLLLFAIGCSPLKTSSSTAQSDLLLHEMQTNIDDLRHDVSCFQAQLKILDSKIDYQEKSLDTLKTQSFDTLSERVDQMYNSLAKVEALAQKEESLRDEMKEVSQKAKETLQILTQYKSRIAELEEKFFTQSKHLRDLSEIKRSLSSLGDGSYRVKPGDTLDKIAKKFSVTIEAIKKENALSEDLIVIGQELKIPK